MKSKLKLRQAIDSLYANGPANHECYTRLALECFRARDVDQAKRLESHMDLHLFKPNDTFIHNRLLNLYAKIRTNFSCSETVRRNVPKRQFLVECHAFVVCKIRVLQEVGVQARHWGVFLRMQKEGCNVFVCNALTDLYARCGEIGQAGRLFDRMLIRNVVTWNLMISGYSKNRQPEKCIDLFHEMQVSNLKPDQVTVSSVLGAYIQCGWKDVASIRSLMKAKHVKKFAAYSWIEIDNEVHRFVADDRTHPDAKIIYVHLNRLIRKLQEAGFSPNTNLVLHDVGEDEKLESIIYHSEKLALAYWLIKKPHGVTPIRIIKNIRICSDCHIFMKFVSNIIRRPVILRDSNRFHHFVEGKCSCKDYWNNALYTRDTIRNADGTGLNVLIDGKECEELHVGRLQQFIARTKNSEASIADVSSPVHTRWLRMSLGWMEL
ncbi:hypothetical protein OIU78_023869 [Salix suchowensis]|nr:hypothetical protein OIU78_023869 [Salix suchowensis]